MKIIKKNFYKQFYPLTIMLFLALVLNCNTAYDDSDLGVRIPEAGKYFAVIGTNPNQGLYEELNGQATFILNSDSALFEIKLNTILSSADTANVNDTTTVTFKIQATEIPTVGEYSVSNIEQINQVDEIGFSGLYFSTSVGLREQYFTESGTLTITNSGNTVIGTFKARIYHKIYIQASGYTRSYSTMEGSFNAVEIIE